MKKSPAQIFAELSTKEREEFLSELTDEQKALFNHCTDLDRKIGTTQFNLDQLVVGKKAFFEMLQKSLAAETSDEVS